jgi:hypothetical protein
MARVRVSFAQLTHLPSVCVCCGQPATRMRRQQFRVSEALTAAFLASATALGFLAWAERSITFALPVCDDHRRRGRRSTRTLLWGMALTAVLGIGAYLRGEFDGPGGNYLTVVAMFTFIATLVIGMHEVNDGLAVKALTGDSLTLTGVNRTFAAAFQAMPDGRGERRRDRAILKDCG